MNGSCRSSWYLKRDPADKTHHANHAEKGKSNVTGLVSSWWQPISQAQNCLNVPVSTGSTSKKQGAPLNRDGRVAPASAAYCTSRMLAGPPRGAAAGGRPGTSAARAEAVETGVGPPSVAGVAAAMVTTTAQARRGWPGHSCERWAAGDGARANRQADIWLGVRSPTLS